MTTYYRRQYPSPPFYAIYMQEPEQWRVDRGFAESVVTAGTIPDSLTSVLEKVSEKEAVNQLARNRAWWNDTVERARLRRKRWAPPACVLMIAGAVMIVGGVVAEGGIHFGGGVPLTVLGVVAAAVGETFFLRLSAVTSQPTLAGPIQKKATPRTRLPRRAVPGTILGLVVGLVLLLGLLPGDLDPWLFAPLAFFSGLVAAGIGLAVSYTSKEWREVKSKRLALRLVMNTVICGGAILLLMELAGLIMVIEAIRHGALNDW